MAKKETNELECECGHIAGAPATLRIHKGLHLDKGAETALDEAIEKATGEVEKVKKVVRRKKNG